MGRGSSRQAATGATHHGCRCREGPRATARCSRRPGPRRARRSPTSRSRMPRPTRTRTVWRWRCAIRCIGVGEAGALTQTGASSVHRQPPYWLAWRAARETPRLAAQLRPVSSASSRRQPAPPARVLPPHRVARSLRLRELGITGRRGSISGLYRRIGCLNAAQAAYMLRRGISTSAPATMRGNTRLLRPADEVRNGPTATRPHITCRATPRSMPSRCARWRP
jgi:hypothetical protein